MIKKLILFTLLSLSFCSFLSSSTYESIKDSSTFELLAPEVNPFWRFTEEELGNKFNYGEDLPPVDTNTISPFSNKTFPKRYNVLEEYPQCVPVVKNQEQCHSSTVFASTTSLAYRFCMKTGKYVELSVQDQISCVRGNKNCALGNLDTTYKYLELIGALSEECFPFVSQNATFYPKCPNECSNKQAEYKRYYAREWMSKEFKQKDLIKEEIMKNGPILGGMILFDDLLLYKSGVYYHQPGSGKQLGWHAFVLYGWDVDEETGLEYYIAQNSWGEEWGEKGFAKFHVDSVGISSYGYAGIPLIEDN